MLYEHDSMPRWIAIFGLQWQVIESHRLEPASDLNGAMTAAIVRLAGEAPAAAHCLMHVRALPSA
jgi:hypothetical protein